MNDLNSNMSSSRRPAPSPSQVRSDMAARGSTTKKTTIRKLSPIDRSPISDRRHFKLLNDDSITMVTSASGLTSLRSSPTSSPKYRRRSKTAMSHSDSFNGNCSKIILSTTGLDTHTLTTNTNESAGYQSHQSDDATASTVTPKSIMKESETVSNSKSLRRKVKRKEKEVNHFINAITQISDRRLEDREQKIASRNEIEKARILKERKNIETWDKFIFEIDSHIEEQTEKRATRLYAKYEIENQLPRWLKTVISITVIIRNCGHSNKLKWRSQSIALMKRAVVESSEDKWSLESRLKLEKFILEINLFTANELLRQLLALKDGYISSRNDSESQLGQLAVLLNEANQNIVTEVVPLMRNSWSSELESADVSRREHAFDSTSTLVSRSSTIKFVKQPKLLNSKGKKCLDVHHSCRNIEQTQAMIEIRKAATAGDFESGWKYFKNYYPAPGKKPGPSQQPVTVEIFKQLMIAFKNAVDVDFKNSKLVFDTCALYGFSIDLSIYNIYLSACIKESRWRRAVSLYKDMQDKFNIAPNYQTFEILANCCRHSLDEPGIIFETLRLENLPVEFCYRAAAANAGNRVSTQVLVEAMHDQYEQNSIIDNSFVPLENYEDFVENIEYDSEVSVKDVSIVSDELAESFRSSTSRIRSTAKNSFKSNTGTFTAMSLNSTSRNVTSDSHESDNATWNMFSNAVRETLPSGSPSRYKPPGSIDLSFQTKLARSLPLRTLVHRSNSSKGFRPQSSWISDMEINENDSALNDYDSLPSIGADDNNAIPSYN